MKTSWITIPIFSLFCLLFFGCTPKSSLKDLEIKDGLYYLKGVSTPYLENTHILTPSVRFKLTP